MGSASSCRRAAGAAVRASTSTAPVASRPETAAPPPAPILEGPAHLIFEYPLGHPSQPGGPGLLARWNYVWNMDGPAVVRRRLPPGLLGLLDRPEQEGALVRRYQFSKRVALRDRMEHVHGIGEIIFLEADREEYWLLCLFCDRPFLGRRLRVLPCDHAFHSSCVDFYFINGDDDWHALGPLCPDCGAPVRP